MSDTATATPAVPRAFQRVEGVRYVMASETAAQQTGLTLATPADNDGGCWGIAPVSRYRTKRTQQVGILYAGLGFTLFSGPNDVGKSAAAHWIASQVLTGKAEGVWYGRPHGVLYVLSEEDPGMVRQAMQAHGLADADMDRAGLYFLAVQDAPGAAADYDTVDLADPDNVEYLRSMCRTADIRMVVFDALVDCMPGANLSDRADVSRVLKMLNKWGNEDDVLLVGIHHNNKGLEGNAKHAVAGSAAFTDKPRVVVSMDQAKDGTRVLQLVKVKGRPDKPAYTYEFGTRFVDTDDGEHKPVGIITKVEPTTLGVDQIRAAAQQEAAAPSRTPDNEVAEWLADYLEDGPAPFKQIAKDAKEAGYTKTQLDNARRRMSSPWVVSRPDTSHVGRGRPRLWELSNEPPTD